MTVLLHHFDPTCIKSHPTIPRYPEEHILFVHQSGLINTTSNIKRWLSDQLKMYRRLLEVGHIRKLPDVYCFW